MKAKILIVDDDEGIRFGFSEYLSKKGYDIEESSSLAEAREAVSGRHFDAVLLDLTLPDGNGLDWIPDLRESCPDTAIIVITGGGEISVAVEAMRRGADNFMTKPLSMADLDVFLKKSLELETLRRKDLTRKRLTKKDKIYFGDTPAMNKAKDLVSLAADNDSTVLLAGETGTGKGVMAKWIHENSARHSASFVEVNCSSLKGEILASELFGHAKGAFTSAVQDQQGLVDVADGGTLFLDEIGDMDPKVQAQFLKVIEEKQYRRVGETKVRKSEFRLICATNHDLPEQTEKGNFRKDLYFRINVFPIQLPPLRERQEDLPGFARHILDSMNYGDVAIPEDVMQLLIGYEWPGNSREMRNVLERAVLLGREETLSSEHFPGLRSRTASPAGTADTWDLDTLEDKHIKKAVEHFGGAARKAAQALGISKATLYRKLKKLEKNE